MVVNALSVSSSQSPVLPDHIGTERFRSSAEIVALGKTKLPPLSDYARACAVLIAATFDGPSMNAVCDRAERETRAASADTFERIISGKTKKPDGHVMQCVMIVAAARGVHIPPALAVRGQP